MRPGSIVKKSVKEIIADKLDIPSEEVVIERAHRLGKKRHPQTATTIPRSRPLSPSLENTDEHSVKPAQTCNACPIIVKFSVWKTKKVLQMAKKKLKQSSISEDFSETVRNIRRKLVPHILSFRKELEHQTKQEGASKRDEKVMDMKVYL